MAALLAAVVASWTCGEGATGPKHVYQMIAVADTVSGHLPVGASEVQFAFSAAADSTYAVFLQTTHGNVLLTASDTAQGVVLGQVLATPGHQLLERATFPFGFGSAPVLLVVTGADSGTFRLFVYKVHRGPEGRSSRFALGDTVQESLETLADIDTFVVAGTAGEELIAYVQATDSLAPGIVSLGVESLAGVGSIAGDSDLQQEASDRFVLPTTRDYRITLQAANDFLTGIRSFHGNYRFQVRAVQRNPESTSVVLQPGDTVTGESIDYVGDIDEFTLAGPPGQEFNVFFQALSGSTTTRLELDVLDSNGQVVTGVQSGGADADLLRQAVGRFAFSGGGPYRLQVFGVNPRVLADRGAYRFWVYPVNRHPETFVDTLVYRDSVMTEAIDFPGDVDEFHVAVPESTLASLLLRLGNDAADGTLELALEDSNGTTIRSVVAAGAGTATPGGSVELTPGNYVLRTIGYSDPRSYFHGHYEIHLHVGFTTRPESVADSVAIGDTIGGEALTPLGDVDVYRFLGQRGEHLNAAIEGQSAPSGGGFAVLLVGPTDEFVGITSSPTAPDSLGAHETGRLDLTDSGWYEVRVIGASDPPVLGEEGPYRLALTLRSTAPEHSGASLVPGDSVTNEVIDTPDDWDEFTVTGSPGQLLTIVTQTLSGTGIPVLAVFDSTTHDTLTWVVPVPGNQPTDYFRLPPSGQVKVAVFHPNSGFSGPFIGAYRFVVIPVNPAPELVPASFSLGDTVQGEGIFPATDVDEFTSTATPGDTLLPGYRLLADPPSGTLLTLEVVDPATDSVLVGPGVAVSGAGTFVTPGFFVVPPGGAYVIRVRGGGSNGERLVTGSYEFTVRLGP